jgi:hypothetical protein
MFDAKEPKWFLQASLLFFQALVAATLSPGSAARTKRQRHTPDDDKQVIVNIQNEEKTQYLEQNFNSSKILIRKPDKS